MAKQKIKKALDSDIFKFKDQKCFFMLFVIVNLKINLLHNAVPNGELLGELELWKRGQ